MGNFHCVARLYVYMRLSSSICVSMCASVEAQSPIKRFFFRRSSLVPSARTKYAYTFIIGLPRINDIRVHSESNIRCRIAPNSMIIRRCEQHTHTHTNNDNYITISERNSDAS